MITTTQNSSQSISYDTLKLLFSSSARVQVVRIFMLDPTRAYYQRQLESAAGLPIRANQTCNARKGPEFTSWRENRKTPWKGLFSLRLYSERQQAESAARYGRRNTETVPAGRDREASRQRCGYWPATSSGSISAPSSSLWSS